MGLEKEPRGDEQTQGDIKRREVPLSQETLDRRKKKLTKVIENLNQAQNPQKIANTMEIVIDL